MKKHWDYSDAEFNKVGRMICTACHRSITKGEFRYRETEEAYLPQHRACSADDPMWAKLDSARAKNDALAAAENAEYGELFDKHFLVTGYPIDPRRAAIAAMRELVVIIKTNPENYF